MTDSVPQDARSPDRAAGRREARQGSRLRLKLLGVTLAAAVCSVSAAYYWWFFRPDSTRASVLFASGTRIRDLQLVARSEGRNPFWHTALGDAYLADGHYLSALEAFKTAAAAGAEPGQLHRRLRACYTRLEQPDLALQEALLVRQREPNSLGALLALVECYEETGKHGEAVKALASVPVDEQGRPLLAAEPVGERELKYARRMGRKEVRPVTDADALEDDPAVEREALSLALVRAGEYERALKLARLGVRYRPQWLGCYLTAGQCLLAMGKPVEALPFLKPAAESGEARYEVALGLRARGRPGDGDQAVKELEAAVAREPTLGRAWWLLAESYTARRLWRPAADCYARANGLGVESPRALKLAAACAARAGAPQAEQQLLGSYYQLAGQPEQALAIYRRRLARHPEDELAYRQVAGALGALKRTPERLALLRRAVARFPTSTTLVVATARTANELHKTDETIALLRQAAAGPCSGSLEVNSLLASALDSIGQVDEAERIYRQLLPSTKAIVGVRYDLAQILLQRREQRSRLREAVRLLEACVATDRSYIPAYRQLGLAYGYLHRDEEAVWALRHAVDLSPGEGTTYEPLAKALVRTGREEEGAWMRDLARRYQEYRQKQDVLVSRTRRRNPSPEDFRALAEFYSRAGALPQAETEYRKLLVLSPTDRPARTRLAEIYGLLGRELDRQELLARAGPPK